MSKLCLSKRENDKLKRTVVMSNIKIRPLGRVLNPDLGFSVDWFIKFIWGIGANLQISGLGFLKILRW